MFSKKILFKASQTYIDNNQDILPTLSKLNIPEWFKNLNHDIKNPTVKGCMPFLDSLTAGYILKMPVDYYVEHNITVDGEKKTGFASSAQFINQESSKINLNFDGAKNDHSIRQLKDSPHVKKNNNLPIHKILNPWIIKTPAGYSTLFTPLLNNQDDRFSIIPAIVDTDTFETEINFPIVFNGDKYKELKTLIKRGTPYVQIIPFKRDNWKMSIKSIDENELDKKRAYYRKLLINNYKTFFWKKKSWK
tara:strand:+ start:1111 stop:1854 length:744 start_codon:yes stop_codon:yes gene_type:complete